MKEYSSFDDLVTDGNSKLEGIKPLLDEGAEVEAILVVIDREQGGRQNLEKHGYRFHAVTRLSDIVGSLLLPKKRSAKKKQRPF